MRELCLHCVPGSLVQRKAIVRSFEYRQPTRMQRIVAPLALGLLIASIWAVVTASGTVEPWRLPSPETTLNRGVQLLAEPVMWTRIAVTTGEALLGCIFGIGVALPLGVALHSSRLITAALEPFLGATQALPAIAIAPLLVLWFGYGTFAISMLCALMVFFPIMISTVVGLNTIDPQIVQAAALDGATGWTMLSRIKFPLAVPTILSGIRNGFTLSFTGAIVGEMVMGGEGLGLILSQTRQSLDTAAMFITIAILCALSASIYHVLRLIEERVTAERFQ